MKYLETLFSLEKKLKEVAQYKESIDKDLSKIKNDHLSELTDINDRLKRIESMLDKLTEQSGKIVETRIVREETVVQKDNIYRDMKTDDIVFIPKIESYDVDQSSDQGKTIDVDMDNIVSKITKITK